MFSQINVAMRNNVIQVLKKNIATVVAQNKHEGKHTQLSFLKNINQLVFPCEKSKRRGYKNGVVLLNIDMLVPLLLILDSKNE